jgi:hypothetical protein
MKTIDVLMTLSIAFSATSCIPIGSHGMKENYFIYINGDTGRTVQISYIECGKTTKNPHPGDKSIDGSVPEFYYTDNNTIITEIVTLPFFKEVLAITSERDNIVDLFLEVASEYDSTTRAVMVYRDLFILRSDSSMCYSVIGNLTGNYDEYSKEDCDYCTTCKGLTADSILNYLKETGYPCYTEFSKGDTYKKVRMYDYWGYK